MILIRSFGLIIEPNSKILRLQTNKLKGSPKPILINLIFPSVYNDRFLETKFKNFEFLNNLNIDSFLDKTITAAKA